MKKNVHKKNEKIIKNFFNFLILCCYVIIYEEKKDKQKTEPGLLVAISGMLQILNTCDTSTVRAKILTIQTDTNLQKSCPHVYSTQYKNHTRIHNFFFFLVNLF